MRGALLSLCSLALIHAACGGDRFVSSSGPGGSAGAAAGSSGAGGGLPGGQGGDAGAAGGGTSAAGAGAGGETTGAGAAGASGGSAGGGGGAGAPSVAPLATCSWRLAQHAQVHDLSGAPDAKRAYAGRVLLVRTKKGARGFLGSGGEVHVVDLSNSGTWSGFSFGGGTDHETILRATHGTDQTLVWADEPGGTPQMLRVPDGDVDGTSVTRAQAAPAASKGRPVMVADDEGGAYVAFVEGSPGNLRVGRWSSGSIASKVATTGDPDGLEPTGIARVGDETHVFTTDLRQFIVGDTGTLVSRTFVTPVIAHASSKQGAMAAFALDTDGASSFLRGGRLTGTDASTFVPTKLPLRTQALDPAEQPDADPADDHLLGFGSTAGHPLRLRAAVTGIDSSLRVDQDLGPTVQGGKTLDGRLLLATAATPTPGGTAALFALWTERKGAGASAHDVAYFNVLDCTTGK